MATHAIEEAFLIPPIHLVREGEIDNDVLRLVLRNVREPETTYGDLMAQIEACRLGERRLIQLLERYGNAPVLGVMEGVIRYSETLIRQEWEKLPDGRYSAVDFIDRDPTVPDAARPDHARHHGRGRSRRLRPVRFVTLRCGAASTARNGRDRRRCWPRSRVPGDSDEGGDLPGNSTRSFPTGTNVSAPDPPR